MPEFWTVPRVWSGGTVAVLASGPSMTQAQADFVRGRVDGVIVINSTFRLAPWADWLHAADAKWWHRNAQEAVKFVGIKTTMSEGLPLPWGIKQVRTSGIEGFDQDRSAIRHGMNSGYQGLHLAMHAIWRDGRVILVGFDMCLGADGRKHHHPDHPDGPPAGPDDYEIWASIFQTLVAPAVERGIDVINCSPRTALDAFTRADLEEVL